MQQIVSKNSKQFATMCFSIKVTDMEKRPDPRLDITRTMALEAALILLQDKGILAVNHGGVSRETGISRSTLYRHWPKLEDLRHATFACAATSPKYPPLTKGPLKTDLIWIIGKLMTALNDTPWGKISPQMVAMAATEDQVRDLMSQWMESRSAAVEAVFKAADIRGELKKDAPVQQLVEMAIAIPYFRKLVSGQPLDSEWIQSHIDMICTLATE